MVIGNVGTISRSTGWLSRNAPSVKAAYVLFQSSACLIKIHGYRRPQSFSCSSCSRPHPWRQIWSIYKFTPHASFTTHNQGLLSLSTIKVIWITFIKFMPVTTTFKVIKIPALRDKSRMAFCCHLQQTKKPKVKYQIFSNQLLHLLLKNCSKPLDVQILIMYYRELETKHTKHLKEEVFCFIDLTTGSQGTVFYTALDLKDNI